jgi:hypothetical protein
MSEAKTRKIDFSNVGEDMPDVLAAIREAISDGMPYAELILGAISDAISESTWTPLPPGSHLVLKDDVVGVEVVALRGPVGRETKAKVITCRGDVSTLSDETQLKIGKLR